MNKNLAIDLLIEDILNTKVFDSVKLDGFEFKSFQFVNDGGKSLRINFFTNYLQADIKDMLYKDQTFKILKKYFEVVLLNHSKSLKRHYDELIFRVYEKENQLIFGNSNSDIVFTL